MPTSVFIVFVHPGSRREPLGFYDGSGDTSSDRQASAIHQCRKEMGFAAIPMTAVPAYRCDAEETARAEQAHGRRTNP